MESERDRQLEESGALEVEPIPDCYACKGTGMIQGFGHRGERCPCLDRDTGEE